MTRTIRRARILLGAATALAACALLSSCGGGTDIAPSDPRIDGQGFASASLGTRDFGESTQVDAGVNSVQATAATATGEPVDVRPDGYALLDHGFLASPVVGLNDGAAPAPTVFCQGLAAACVGTPTCGVPATIPCDFWVADSAAGLLQVSPSGRISTGQTVYATYTYNERLLTMDIGLTFASGQFLTILVYHMPQTQTGPLDLTQVQGAPPVAPYPMAFNAILQTNLTTSGDRQLYTAMDDPANLLHFSRIDLTNEGNPCFEGTLNVVVDADPSPLTVTATFRTPGC